MRKCWPFLGCALNVVAPVFKSVSFPTYARQSLTSTCYECEQPCNYLFDDGRCCRCTRLTREEIEGEIQEELDLGFSGSVSDTPTKVWFPILIDTFCHLDGDSSLQTELAL